MTIQLKMIGVGWRENETCCCRGVRVVPGWWHGTAARARSLLNTKHTVGDAKFDGKLHRKSSDFGTNVNMGTRGYVGGGGIASSSNNFVLITKTIC